MARKACPKCKRVTGASARTCSGCGHVFENVEVAKAEGVKRCVECGVISRASVEQCQCGFRFDVAPEDLRGLLAQRRSAATGMLVGSIALGILSALAFLGLIAAMALLQAISVRLAALGFVLCCSGLAAATAGCRKAMRILGAVRVNRGALAAREAALPEARIVR